MRSCITRCLRTSSANKQQIPGIEVRGAQRRVGRHCRIKDAIEYLDSVVEHDVSLDDLCRITGLGRRQTITAFRRVTGLPPHAWHLQKKVLLVKRLLRAGLSPADAAAQAGFSDQSHMGRHFKAIVGITPAAFARG